MANDLRWTPEWLAAHEANMRNAPKGRELRISSVGVVSIDPRSLVSSPKVLQQVEAAKQMVLAQVSKYKNEKTDGYHSKKEAKRASDLRLMQEAGQIRNLREQVQFEIIPKQDGERSAHYIADFQYEEFSGDGWREVTEDCKGYRTADYVLKRKLMLHVHGIKIRET